MFIFACEFILYYSKYNVSSILIFVIKLWTKCWTIRKSKFVWIEAITIIKLCVSRIVKKKFTINYNFKLEHTLRKISHKESHKISQKKEHRVKTWKKVPSRIFWLRREKMTRGVKKLPPSQLALLTQNYSNYPFKKDGMGGKCITHWKMKKTTEIFLGNLKTALDTPY